MIPTNDETYTIELTKKKDNTPYVYENAPCITFKGRPMNQIERKNYRVEKGVNGGSDSAYIKATNLPKDIAEGDRIRFLGKIWTVMSVGYIFDQARLVNASCLSEQQIVDRCPKGINVQ